MAIQRSARGVRRQVRESLEMENCQGVVRLELSVFEHFLRRLRRELQIGRHAVFVRLVSDSEMARLNGKFRKTPKTTDVLSFPSEERRHPSNLRSRLKTLKGEFLGDIAISPVVARRNAKLFGRSFEQEICMLMLHGVLHLLGYDHETDHGEMERVEVNLRRRLRLV